MQRLHLDKDIQPLSEFRANAATFLDQLKKTGRPIVLTQRGKSSAVLIDVSEYEKLLEQVETLTDIFASERQIEKKEYLTNSKAKERILKRIRKWE